MIDEKIAKALKNSDEKTFKKMSNDIQTELLTQKEEINDSCSKDIVSILKTTPKEIGKSGIGLEL